MQRRNRLGSSVDTGANILELRQPSKQIAPSKRRLTLNQISKRLIHPLNIKPIALVLIAHNRPSQLFSRHPRSLPNRVLPRIKLQLLPLLTGTRFALCFALHPILLLRRRLIVIGLLEACQFLGERLTGLRFALR